LASAEAPITSLQPPYSLVATDVQDATLPYALSQQIGVIVYSPVGSGVVRRNFAQPPIGSRVTSSNV
jgi:aryl-alcohol dehydrogenase-like predicted oxidoreductase